MFPFPSFIADPDRPLSPYHLSILPIICLTCVTGSLLPPGILRGVGTPTVLLYLFYQIPKATCGLVLQDYLLPTQAGFILIQWADFFTFRDPRHPPLRIKDHGTVPDTFWKKLSWSTDLFLNQRGLGWNWQVSNVPKGVPAGTSRW